MILSAVLNIVISITAAKQFGIVGIQLGTLAAYLPIAFGRIRFVVKNFFGQSMSRYIAKHSLLLIVAIGEMVFCQFVCHSFAVNIAGLIARFFVWLLLPLLLNSVLYYRNPYFHDMLSYAKRSAAAIFSKRN